MAPDDGPAALVVNTQSRSGREAYSLARDALASRGVILTESHALSKSGRLRRVLEQMLARGTRRILVGGGDGTLSGAVAHLLGRDVTLGVLPLGTGNDFARSLGIPPDVESACDVIAKGYAARVDVGLANGRPFLNAASLGLAAAIARRLTKRLKQRAGKLAYPVAAAAEAKDLRPFRIRIKADEQELELDVLQLVVGNGRYHGAGNMVAPDARLDDRRLHVYAVAAPSSTSGRDGTGLGQLQDLATLARVALSVRSGEHGENPAVTSLLAVRLYVEATPPQEVNADGELVGMTPMRFEVAPAALRVYAPAPS
ncbi:lipid kinase [Myxococcus llanfairpwllgwyngyllgogerychwyrndrobwllllantysiliogogogochensis]|uniref:Lipid kinase n=1 Tax=Myxococcus llanfairpwllgwyngyllgogerychwyrndrobwllllantysiliogogogochensis TaxID=2590453 RepID=A0A540WSL2_9BACT|nr:lipid kinase [Myxococcus llanfairpwllgwyngyllgogerychwyrndrobwllllantysiliogogogochensis]